VGLNPGLSGQKATPTRLGHQCPRRAPTNVIIPHIVKSNKLRFEKNIRVFFKNAENSLNFLHVFAVNMNCVFKSYEVLRRVYL